MERKELDESFKDLSNEVFRVDRKMHNIISNLIDYMFTSREKEYFDSCKKLVSDDKSILSFKVGINEDKLTEQMIKIFQSKKFSKLLFFRIQEYIVDQFNFEFDEDEFNFAFLDTTSEVSCVITFGLVEK